MFTRGRIALSVLAVSALALVGCTDSGDDTATTAGETATTAAGTATTAAAAEGDNAEWVTFTEGFIKAKPAEKDMTGIFGTFTNNSDEDINLVAFTSELDVPRHELHEVVDGVMQMKPGGFVIPAGGTHELKPGADHMMLMDYTEPIEAGDTVTITLEFGDGSTQEVKDIPVRTIASGEESYGSDGSLQGHEMSH
ncbi:copper chaperone PCu(A)C [Corynebacterium nasicanis]|uniref:Copper chaperone PCu(A)C n=1 Tax=Corynebacterium nasicanis TaxID=1448267 RepID=A0ABW1Q7B8_9CORY